MGLRPRYRLPINAQAEGEVTAVTLPDYLRFFLDTADWNRLAWRFKGVLPGIYTNDNGRSGKGYLRVTLARAPREAQRGRRAACAADPRG